MTGFKSKKTAALDEEGMYLVHQTAQPAQDSCFCHSGVSLQMVSGGAAPEGYLGWVTLLIDGAYVDYVRARPAQEPVAWMDADGDVLSASVVDGKGLRNIPLYTTPPQRPWVDLTFDEKQHALYISDWKTTYMEAVIEYLEAKLKEKNA